MRVSGRFGYRTLLKVIVNGHFLGASINFDYAFEPRKFDFVSKIFRKVLKPVLSSGVLFRSFKVLPQIRHESLF